MKIRYDAEVDALYISNCKREAEKRGLAPWRNPMRRNKKRCRHGACPLFSRRQGKTLPRAPGKGDRHRRWPEVFPGFLVRSAAEPVPFSGLPIYSLSYIELRSLEPGTAECREFTPDINADYGPDGRLAGLEILDASVVLGNQAGKVVLELAPMSAPLTA